MSQTYFPFDSGAGANATEAQWTKMAQNWLGTGAIKSYLNELQVYADSTGMQAKVKSGAAWMRGHYFESDAEEVLAIGTADATNPRIDRVIVRVDWALNTVQLAILQGTQAVSPTAPILTQNSSRWEISLAKVTVGANVSTIAAGNVTDDRNFVKNANSIQPPWIDAVLQNSWVADTGKQPRYYKDETGHVHFEGDITGGATADGTVLFTLPTGYRPEKDETWGILTYDGSLNTMLSELKVKTTGEVTIAKAVNQWYIKIGHKIFRQYQ